LINLSKYRDNPNLRSRYKHEPTRYHDTYSKWIEALINSEPSLSHLIRPKRLPPYERWKGGGKRRARNRKR
jgi:hypothetical protein